MPTSDVPPEVIDKNKARMRLFRAEVHYLTANEWICYVPGVQDPETGDWKCWADRDTPKVIIDQDEAVRIQKLRDLEKDKQNADNG